MAEFRCSDEAAKMIIEAMKKKGRFDDYREYRLGSWWYLEFRQNVTDALEKQGEDTAQQYIQSELDGIKDG